MGDGTRIDFWVDHWTEVFSLKSSFPRIFTLALKKSGKIVEFRFWENRVWEWKIDLRREFFEWERAIWSEFLLVLSRAVSLAPGLDRLYWLGATNGWYTPKSFCSKVASAGKMEDSIWKVVWYKFVPPKVSCFVWKTVHQRLPVSTELVKRGVLSSDSSLCSFCNQVPETVNHVLNHVLVQYAVLTAPHAECCYCFGLLWCVARSAESPPGCGCKSPAWC
ncbi:hypothetical protein F3Y22_tig00116951pilonHSYRG00169 [Hibiscus syriacus]|uniref:Reverse transcriptase zinc-binding domain-containing protein n=1 Tax=Hibiscus syriacus TaxID=106335 RepID=A0A6A2WY11_HIBSY|nr:hypothetical protein F3Y22_tig00116951pilonHSYRG00169 [Hibiscus syriacus]